MNITDYLQLQHGNDVSKAIQNMKAANLTLPPIPTPTSNPVTKQPIPVSDIDVYLWKNNYKKASTKKDSYNKNILIA